MLPGKKVLENRKVRLLETLMIAIIRISPTDTFDTFMVLYECCKLSDNRIFLLHSICLTLPIQRVFIFVLNLIIGPRTSPDVASTQVSAPDAASAPAKAKRSLSPSHSSSPSPDVDSTKVLAPDVASAQP